MQTNRLTKQDERKWMQDHARERTEAEKRRPPEQQHAGADWVARFWRKVSQ